MRLWQIIFWIIIALVIIIGASLILLPRAKANISSNSTEHWAWNDLIGWIDFYNNTDTVIVTGEKLTGYVSSSIGEIWLDCQTTSKGNVCGAINHFGICNGENATHQSDGTCQNFSGNGNLKGWAWNDLIGWISFSCLDTDSCIPSPYGVRITNFGAFQNYAWNDLIGWINFNCNNQGTCQNSDFKVQTDWQALSGVSAVLVSSIFDTQITSGATLNSIIWQGVQPGTDSCVKFQIAVSNQPTGPWNYYGPGPSDQDFFGNNCPSDDVPIKITTGDRNWIANKRYLRYKVILRSSTDVPPQSPVIDDIILNWSR